MVHKAEALLRRHERTERRREQVLDAAEACFLAEGFHGASMNRIAAVANMSVGHIYRYFESKDAIIIALCERRFAGFEDLITAAERAHPASASQLLNAWISQFVWWLDRTRAPLTVEITSEAGRNPTISKVVTAIDRRFRNLMRDSLVPLGKSIPPQEVENRLEAVVMLSHGMSSRITADPDADPARILEAFRLAVHELLKVPPA